MPAYEENSRLREFFRVISLSLDKGGRPYVSTMEAWRYPITATQWHPEKNNFEWTPTLKIPHTKEAVRGSGPPAPPHKSRKTAVAIAVNPSPDN